MCGLDTLPPSHPFLYPFLSVSCIFLSFYTIVVTFNLLPSFPPPSPPSIGSCMVVGSCCFEFNSGSSSPPLRMRMLCNCLICSLYPNDFKRHPSFQLHPHPSNFAGKLKHYYILRSPTICCVVYVLKDSGLCISCS